MKFQVGDRVLLLHSNEEGEVVDIIDKKMVSVEVDGVQFPVYTDQIDFPYFKRFTEQKKELPKPQKKYIDNVKKEKGSAVKNYKVGTGIWISFLPVFDKDIFDDDVVDYFRIYLVNNTDTSFQFDYHLRYTGDSEFDLKNEILPYNDFYIHDVDFEKMNDSPRFEFEFSLTEPHKKKAEHVEASLKLKAKQLFQRIEEMLKNNEACFNYLLLETYPDRVVTEKVDMSKLTAAGFKIYDAGKARQHIPPARTVVDLHIEKLIHDWKHLSNFEILTAQLKEFEKFYELSVLHFQPTLTIIHGVGEGRLRDEIHDLLRLKSEVKSFVNQYHPQYGYGATEIFFQYK